MAKLSFGAIAAVLALCALFAPMWGPYLYFIWMKGSYDKAVRALPGATPHVKLFVWEMDPVGGRGVVYDDHDDIELPRSRRPKNWAHREVEYPAALDELCNIQKVAAHYYIVSFGCYGDGK